MVDTGVVIIVRQVCRSLWEPQQRRLSTSFSSIGGCRLELTDPRLTGSSHESAVLLVSDERRRSRCLWNVHRHLADETLIGFFCLCDKVRGTLVSVQSLWTWLTSPLLKRLVYLARYDAFAHCMCVTSYTSRLLRVHNLAMPVDVLSFTPSDAFPLTPVSPKKCSITTGSLA